MFDVNLLLKMPFFGLFVTILLKFRYNSVASNDNKFLYGWQYKGLGFMGSDELILLDKSLFLGKGTNRICYCHPQDRSKCVKIDLNEKRRITPRELKYYRRYVRKGVTFELIAPFYGEVMTNFGKGYVFGLARDYDGEVSRSVGYYLNVCRDEQFIDGLFRGLLELKEFMIFYGIMARTIERQNMLYQQTSPHNGKVIFIDGIGNNQFLPSANYLRFHARRVVRRKWLKFELQLMRKYQDTSMIYERLKALGGNHRW